MQPAPTVLSVGKGGPPARLLLPVDASHLFRSCLRHVVHRHQAGERFEVFLLHVAEPVRQWEVLRFHAEEEIRRRFRERSAVFLIEAAGPLRAAGVPCNAYFREGKLVQGIIDFAEEMACTDIVVPRGGLFSASLARRLQRKACPIPVTQIRPDGSSEP